MDTLYLEIYNHESERFDVPLETLIIYFVYRQLKTPYEINFIESISKRDISFTVFIDTDYKILKKLPISATYCVAPLVVTNNVTIVSGLCSVARQLIKSSGLHDDSRKLLGFREACLMACNESSVWTKFCEIDMVKMIKSFLNEPDVYFAESRVIPEDLSRFECHLSQPVRIHNVYKVAQDQAKLKNKIVDVSTQTPKEHLDLEHSYGEGPYMTLADVILYPVVHIYHEVVGIEGLPLVHAWYVNMTKQVKSIQIENLPDFRIFAQDKEVVERDIERQSLYVSDPKRYKPRNRVFTKQPDVLNALNIVNTLDVNVEICDKPFGFDVDFNWLDIPLEANPEGGALPKSRMKRKCEQLENLTKAVMKIAKPQQTIVDFCSGSGHLGILLAIKLPKCKIILLENKEASLKRARERVEKLQLDNVVLLQCNLDYFKGDFDVGVSLHACGVATDLVIQHCLRRNAAFVACPCCYGGVHVCHHISYPRSTIFRNSQLTLRDYLVLGHSADQTHDAQNAKTKQGIECMNIIDTDRKYQAEESGYKVFLAKMIPDTCTPKNNILVGIPSTHKNQL